MTVRPEGSGRRGRPGHEQRDVLRVAVDLFNRQGYDATSVGDVARELGLTKSAIYHHVPSKEHLLQSAVDEALDALTAALDVVSADEGLDAEQRLPVEKAALARRRGLDERLADMVREAVDEGVLRADLDPLMISRLVFGMVNSLVEWVRPGVDAEAVADAVAVLAFDGLTHGARSPDRAGSGSDRGTPR